MLETAFEIVKLAVELGLLLATLALIVVTRFDLPDERVRALTGTPIIGRFMRVTSVTETVTETVQES